MVSGTITRVFNALKDQIVINAQFGARTVHRFRDTNEYRVFNLVRNVQPDVVHKSVVQSQRCVGRRWPLGRRK